MMGIGAGFDIPMYWTAGAVVSGAYFGDKVSPLSDTTNLAPAVTGTDVFSHIKNMMPTTIPAMVIAFIVYLVAGFALVDDGAASFDRIDAITTALQANFTISAWLLLPAVLVIVLAVKRMPPIPALFAGVLAGAIPAIFVQGVGVHDLWTYANDGYAIDTGIGAIDSLLNRGGIQSMMWTISLVLIALGFGGALEKIGCLDAIVCAIMSKVRSFKGLQTSAVLTSVSTNLVAGDPYLSMQLWQEQEEPIATDLGAADQTSEAPAVSPRPSS